MRSIDRIYLPGPFGLSLRRRRPKASFAPDFARRTSRKRDVESRLGGGRGREFYVGGTPSAGSQALRADRKLSRILSIAIN